MSSLSFDPVAHIYDTTRGYPDSIVPQIARAIDRAADATPGTAFLEVGIGTGRIALPLVSLGRNYTGVDIAPKMVGVLEDKLRAHGWQEYEQVWGSLPDEESAVSPTVHRFTHSSDPTGSMRLAFADMTALPFRDASFDVVVAVHVFHLVGDWRQAVREVLRVLRPGGVLLHCWDEHSKVDGQYNIGEKWRRIAQELGGNVERPGASSEGAVTQWLQEQGLPPEQVIGPGWQEANTPRQLVQYMEQRYGSHTWQVPDDLFAVSMQRLWQWAHAQFGASIDMVRQRERRFIISKTRV